MKKVITVFLVLLITVSVFSVKTSALPTEEYEKESNISNNYYINYDQNGNIISQNLPKQTRAGTHSVTKRVDYGNKSGVYLGYHPDTSIWRKVDSYAISESKTVSMSLTVSGYKTSIGVSRTTSSSFSYSIKTNQNQFSKLKVYVGFRWEKYRADIYDNYTGNYISTQYLMVTTRTHEEFKPDYQ